MSSPLYGSDSPGTLMDKNIPWNLSDLYSLLKDGLNYQKWDGITHPYLYFGCWKSMFGFHKEDMDLCSINYHHFGEPKHWYAIAGRDKEKFETLVKKLYPSQYKACKEFIRHKTILLHPDVLLKNDISVYKCIQKPGEFVITTPHGYHAGFNYGFNCAEAVNFCTSKWVNYGADADNCKCSKNSVKIPIDEFLFNLIDNKNIQNEKYVNLCIKNTNKNIRKRIFEEYKINYNKKSNNLKFEVDLSSASTNLTENNIQILTTPKVEVEDLKLSEAKIKNNSI